MKIPEIHFDRNQGSLSGHYKNVYTCMYIIFRQFQLGEVGDMGCVRLKTLEVNGISQTF
jgi:hypothetical protein